MIKKTPVKGTDKISVTFDTTSFPNAETVTLAGDFNNWDPVSHPLKQRKDGSWSIALRLPKEKDFQYRFVVDGETWHTDEGCDEQVLNEFGEKNALVRV